MTRGHQIGTIGLNRFYKRQTLNWGTKLNESNIFISTTFGRNEDIDSYANILWKNKKIIPFGRRVFGVVVVVVVVLGLVGTDWQFRSSLPSLQCLLPSHRSLLGMQAPFSHLKYPSPHPFCVEITIYNWNINRLKMKLTHWIDGVILITGSGLWEVGYVYKK